MNVSKAQEFRRGWSVLLAGTLGIGIGLSGLLPYNSGLFIDDLNKEIGLSKTQFGLAFFLALIAAVNLAMYMGPENRPEMGALWGFLAGFGWVATFVGTLYLFERKSFTLFLINAGYSIVALTIMGVIIAAWK